MTQQRDIERVLDQWFSDGPIQAPDRVVDIVGDRIERQTQRPAWRLHWRPTTVNAYAKIAVAAAAVLLVAVVGYNLLPAGTTGTGGPAPTAVPIPSSTPVASPIALLDGRLAAGRYRIRPLESLPNLSVVADVPAGWTGFPDNSALTGPERTGEPVLIAFMTTEGLNSDPCHWDPSKSGHVTTVGPTVDDLVAALKANASYPSTAASPVTLGRFQGKELELQLPGADVIPKCDRRPGEKTGDYFVFPDGYYAQGANNRWHLYIVDVAGTRLITMISIPEGVLEADVAAAENIVRSFQFEP